MTLISVLELKMHHNKRVQCNLAWIIFELELRALVSDERVGSTNIMCMDTFFPLWDHLSLNKISLSKPLGFVNGYCWELSLGMREILKRVYKSTV